MDPHRSPYRGTWRPPTYATPVYSPPPMYGATSRMYGSPVGSVPIGVSYSSRSLARSSLPSPPSPRRWQIDEGSESSSSGGYSTGRSSYRRTQPTPKLLDHYDMSTKPLPAPQSSKLSRRIDKFLQSSEQTMDRIKRRKASSSGIVSLDSPDLSLSLSSRAYRSTSAASIAAKAGKHLESLTDNNKPANGVCSTSESLDNLDSDSDEDLDVSDATSADLSKLSTDVAEGSNNNSNTISSSSSSAAPAAARAAPAVASKAKDLLDDLSSDSDDEFFDFIPLGNRPLVQNPVLKLPTNPANKKLPITKAPAPIHSQSVPAVNKLLQSGVGKMAGGASVPKSSANAKATNSTIENKAIKQAAHLPPERAVTPSPSLKKYPAPQPPGSISRQASSASIARPASVADPGAALALTRQHSSASIARNSVAFTDEGSGRRCQRTPSIKKYPAPQPPGVSRQSSMASIAALAANDKLIAAEQAATIKNNVTEKSLTNGVVTTNKQIECSKKESTHNSRLSNGHIEDVLSAFKRGSSESMHILKNGDHKSEKSVNNGKMIGMESTKSNDTRTNQSANSNQINGINEKTRCTSREVSVEKTINDDDKSRRSPSRDPSSKKSLTGRLAVMANKFESDSSTTTTSDNQKLPQKSESDVKGKKFSNKVAKNKLGSLTSKFEANDSSPEIKSPIISKLQSSYSKPFDPFDPEPSALQSVVQRRSIGGINVSKFGGTGKFPTHGQLRKSSKAGIEDEKDEKASSCNDKNQLTSTSSGANETLIITNGLESSVSLEKTLTNGVDNNEIEINKTSALSDSATPTVANQLPDGVAPLASPESTDLGTDYSRLPDLSLKTDACMIQTSIKSENVKDNNEPGETTTMLLPASQGSDTLPPSGGNVPPQSGISLISNGIETPAKHTFGQSSCSDSSALVSMSGDNSLDKASILQSSIINNTENVSKGLNDSILASDLPSILDIESLSKPLVNDSNSEPQSSIDALPSSVVSASDTTVPNTGSQPLDSPLTASNLELPPSSSSKDKSDLSSRSTDANEPVLPCTSYSLIKPELATTDLSMEASDVVALSLLPAKSVLDAKYEPTISSPTSPEYYSPALQLMQSSFTMPSDYSVTNSMLVPYSNPSSFASALTSPRISIYTRASSVSPSIVPLSTYLSNSGLNTPYNDAFRARSLAPLDDVRERSVRPKSRFLSSNSRANVVTASALDLDKPESALEKYRRRKDLRNSVAKSKLDALTNQSKTNESTNGNSSEVCVSGSSVSSSEGSKFKLDLTTIKDFLRKTEEEISKLPRYIREPWSMTEILTSRSSSVTAIPAIEYQPSSSKENIDPESPGMLTPTTSATECNSRKSSDNSVDKPFNLKGSNRNSDGDDEVYVDANDAIDTSQMDTLMPLPDTRDIERRCRSVTPSRVLANTEKVLSETDRILKKSRSGNSLRKSYSRSMSAANIDRLSEVVADLAEEHSTAQLAGERLEAEQADRMRLEKELDGAQGDTRDLTLATERLESEKTALRTEMLQQASCFNNGDISDIDDASSASLYKRKFEWSQREVESLKHQLRQHQQDEQEQTALLKKQLEKKIADAREETEEQRQVAGQLKKRTQRLQAEMNDLKILLEEQAARNCLLEKKQRKFDSDLAGGQDELRVERLNKEKVMRERDAHLAEKYAVDQELSTLKLELELRDERVAALTRQVDDLSVSGQGDHELTQLRKAKHELESKIKDQEEELDELAGQVQMLEAARTRLEMSIEQMRKENRKEVQQREEEVEEVRISAQKKVKALEAQVETEHEERTHLVRDKHELERRLLEVMDRSSVAPDEDAIHRLKKDLRKTKALLKDTQTMLEKSQSEGPSKLIIRQLKTQLEDCEFAKTAALKARQSADADLCEVQSSLEDTQRARKDADDRATRLLKEKTELQTQLEEGEELHVETLKKYKATVSQISVDQITLSEQSQRISELEHEKQMLSDRLLELSSKVEVLEGETANIHTQRMLQMKVKELESKLELEAATRKRIEGQVSRQKEQIERLSGECDLSKLKECQSQDQSKKLNRQLRQAKEEAATLQQRNTELSSKKQEIEKQMELMDSEISTLKSDLKLAFKRIEDLQMALQGDISDSDSDLSDSDSDTSLTNYLTSSVRASRSSTSSSYAAASNSTRQPNRTGLSPTSRGEDLMSPGSDAMAIIEEAKEEMQHSGSESFA